MTEQVVHYIACIFFVSRHLPAHTSISACVAHAARAVAYLQHAAVPMFGGIYTVHMFSGIWTRSTASHEVRTHTWMMQPARTLGTSLHWVPGRVQEQ